MDDSSPPSQSPISSMQPPLEKPSIFNLHDGKVESVFTRDLTRASPSPPPPLPPSVGPINYDNQFGIINAIVEWPAPIERRSTSLSLRRGDAKLRQQQQQALQQHQQQYQLPQRHGSGNDFSIPINFNSTTNSYGSGVFGGGGKSIKSYLITPSGNDIEVSGLDDALLPRRNSRKSGATSAVTGGAGLGSNVATLGVMKPLYTATPPAPTFNIAELESALQRHLDTSSSSSSSGDGGGGVEVIENSVGDGGSVLSGVSTDGQKRKQRVQSMAKNGEGTPLEFKQTVNKRTPTSLFMEALEGNIANEST
ncbi:UNVERIFIED_CONTAM: hypothetical protein HDU68_011452 [Siphonaria sp. JEL0065]|nr:hypothetical protein HDU68_011452 [Siphonaria sp. JEL0065]